MPAGGHTCGVTVGHAAYCWGSNFAGRLGDGTITDRLTPVTVAGGLPFAGVSAGGLHTCGKITDNRAYCWGWNAFGQLGNGTTTGEQSCSASFGLPCTTKPVEVVGPS